PTGGDLRGARLAVYGRGGGTPPAADRRIGSVGRDGPMKVTGYLDQPVWEVRNPRRVFLYSTGVRIGPQRRRVAALIEHDGRGVAVWIDGEVRLCPSPLLPSRTDLGVETATAEVPLD